MRTAARWRPRILGLAMLMALPLLLLVGLSVQRSARMQEQRVTREREALVRSAALVLAGFVQGNLTAARALAALPSLTDPANSELLRVYFARLLAETPDWDGLGLADADGWVVVSPQLAPYTINLGDRAYFQEALRTGQPVVSSAVINRRSGLPAVIIAVPVAQGNGQRAVFVVTLATARIAGALAALQPAGTTRAVVLDREGQVFVHPDPAVTDALTSRRGAAPVEAALRGETGSARTREAGGREVLTAYASVAGVGWAVLLEQPAAAALGPVRNEVLISLSLIALAAAVTAALAWYFGSRFTRLYQREFIALQQAEAALGARDTFLSSASHDLKTPLTTIKGLVQLMQRRAARTTLTAEHRWLVEGLEGVDRAASKMSRQINALLDTVRLQANEQMQLERRETDLVRLVREVAAEQQEATERHRITFEAGVPALVGLWDPERLERVLSNLLSNAVKYSPDGGDVTVRVARVGEGSAGEARVSVHDRGLGIPAADLPHVFDRFYRGANVVGQIAGSGIGLAGAAAIVAQHGGRLQAESVEGQGSTFTICLPLTAAPTTGPATSDAPSGERTQHHVTPVA